MRDEIYKSLEVIQTMNRKYELRTLEKRIISIYGQMEQFSLKILFVGGFSAGKSALINKVIGEDLLQEGQTPTTAIACEIIYDTEEYIEAVAGSNKERYTVEKGDLIDVGKYDFLVWHLNRESLKNNKDCTLVDMPGFNSGIQAHNKAILRYVGRGNAYVLVINCEDGSIKQDAVQFIKEIKQYDSNIAIVITQTDLKPEAQVSQIKESIIRSVETIFAGQNIPVITTSKYDDKAGEKVEGLICEFDKEKIFVQEFLPQVCDIGIRCIDSLETYKKGIQFDLSQFDREIDRHEKAKKELTDKLKSEKAKLEKQFRNTVEPQILADAEKALYDNEDELVNGLKGGEKNFSMIVNYILRPVFLESTKQYVEQSFEQFMSEINFVDMDSSLQSVSANAINKYRQANGKIQEILENGDKFSVMYKTLTTTLAVITNMIAPWLELIIIFLPNILKLFTKINQEDKLKNQVREIIPKIVEGIKPEIQKSLNDMKEEMIKQSEEEIGSLIDSEVESLKSARDNKEKASMEFDKKVMDIEQDIDEIKTVLEQIV